MVFKRIRQAMGVGGPSVATVLVDPNCLPGGRLEGTVMVTGGEHPVDVSYLALGLSTRVEVASGENGYATDEQFHRQRVTGPFRLEPGQRYDVPFRFDVPWETPVTVLYGQHLPGMSVGLRTQLAVARALDQGDLDPVAVHPLPAQQRLLDALLRLGFRFARADVERGHLYGVHQTLPFYQEIEFYPAAQYAGAMNQLEVTFVAGAGQLQVVLELDRRGGLLTAGRDAFGRFAVEYATVDQTDWAARLDDWLRQSLRRRGLFG
ncbi:sporulation protein [Micromonospora radicis]|uniref:Sporulation protein n=1 Tax=Micromonospora radicis TaxID=1894971 RepID=A0A418N0J3_9ACTN|nr:sporulation protein [Micromonospora radicis]RIV40853.1 sporulation protein [Micromonospora radicis]